MLGRIGLRDSLEYSTSTPVRHLRRLDCAFNNAGIGGGGLLHEWPEEEWDRLVNMGIFAQPLEPVHEGDDTSSGGTRT